MKPIQIIRCGKILDGYFIDYKNGIVRIFSVKGYGIKDLSMPTSGKATYPKIRFSVKGETCGADIHRVIAEHLIPFPRPKNITKQDWDATPETVKSIVKHSHRVNHIDHNKYNWHPSNLEWVTAQENSQKAVDFYKDKS